MIFPVWLACVILAVVLTAGITVWGWSHPLAYIGAGLFWLIAAFSSSSIEFIVSYKDVSYDYLKEFTYSYLTVFFGFVGVWMLLGGASESYHIIMLEAEGGE